MLVDDLGTYRERSRNVPVNLGVLRPIRHFNGYSGMDRLPYATAREWLKPEFQLLEHRKRCLDYAYPNWVTIPDYMGFEIIRDHVAKVERKQFPFGITDTLKSRMSQRFKPVWHLKSGFQCLPFLKLIRDTRDGNVIHFDPAWRRSDNVNYSLSAMSRLGPEPERDLMFSARAYWNMRPRFAQGVNLLNSIFELKDFRDVRRILPSLWKLVGTPQGRRRLSSIAAEAKARDLTGAAANVWLLKTLALDPTIRDIMAIWAQAQQDCFEALQEYMDFGKEGSVSHFTEWDRTQAISTGTGNNKVVGSGWSVTTNRTATARYWYDYDIPSRNRLLREWWGLTGTVETLWNMLPFSFVVDYFMTIGKSLAAMERDNHVNLVNMEYCESHTTWSRQGSFIVDQAPVLLALIIDNEPAKITGTGIAHLVTGHEVKRYIRLPCRPYAGPALPRLKLPSGKQALTIAALLRVLLF